MNEKEFNTTPVSSSPNEEEAAPASAQAAAMTAAEESSLPTAMTSQASPTGVVDFIPVPEFMPGHDSPADVIVSDPGAEMTPKAAVTLMPTASPSPAPTGIPDPPDPEPFPMVPVVVLVLLAVLAVAAVLLFGGRKKKKMASPPQKPTSAPAKNQAARNAAPAPGTGAAMQTEAISFSDTKAGKEKQTMNGSSEAPSSSRYRVGYAQTVGMRPNQEDSYGVSTLDTFIQKFGLLAVVADGIGGMADGQVASERVVHSMFDLLVRLPATDAAADRLLKLAVSAQNSVLDINRHTKARCGSTLVSVLMNNDRLAFLSIGDSRIYLLRSGALLQLNREHEVGPGHDENVALGYTEETLDARRRAALTSYVGKENLVQIDRNTQPLQLIHGDRILLMSDGVFGTLSDSELTACLSGPAQQAAERVIAAVSAKGLKHQDNATIVIVDYP